MNTNWYSIFVAILAALLSSCHKEPGADREETAAGEDPGFTPVINSISDDE